MRSSGWVSAARAPPTLCYPVPAIPHPHRVPGRARLWDDRSVSEPTPARRRDPAWVWYALAVAALAAVALLDAAGVLDRIGP